MPVFSFYIDEGFELCPKATYVAFIDQCKHWSIPLFCFPVPPLGKTECKRIPPSPPNKKGPSFRMVLFIWYTNQSADW